MTGHGLAHDAKTDEPNRVRHAQRLVQDGITAKPTKITKSSWFSKTKSLSSWFFAIFVVIPDLARGSVLAKRFRCQPEDRRRRNTQHPEHQVDLAAVMGF